MIKLNNISLAYGSQAIFDDITCSFSPKAHIGLIGRNGSGKSTLLQTLAEMVVLDDGYVDPGHLSIAYLPQEIVMNSTKTVLEEGYADEEVEPEELALKIVEVKKILQGLGFTDVQLSASVAELSTGWKMRLLLAKLLLKKADFYLFDEPTNHLDIFAQEWLLNFLKSAPFGFMLVCHERSFLNKACDHIFELERGKGTLYKGSYEAYLVHKEEYKKRLASAYEQQQKEIAHRRETADRFKAKASKASFAQSLLKKIDKMELIEAPHDDTRTVNIVFPPVQRAAKQIMTVSNVSKSFIKKDNRIMLFQKVNFTIERDMKVALVAANGVGKTTLFKIITGEQSADTGTIDFGGNVLYAYFKQNQHETLNQELTIWEEISRSAVKKSETDLRRMLGCFLFSGESIHKKIKVLSGGEKNRLCMLKTLLEDSNVLFLDEPTNHLDIISKDLLLKALKAYPGTVIFVSHDQHFVNNLATHIVELTPQGTTLYAGNFDEFMEQKKYRDARSAHDNQNIPSKEKVAASSEKSFELNKKISRLEGNIKKLEAVKQDLISKLEEAPPGTSEYQQLIADFGTLEKNIATMTAEWELLAHSTTK